MTTQKFSENQFKEISKENINKIITQSLEKLKDDPINKFVNRYGDGSFFTYMPIIDGDIIFTKYVTRGNGSTHSAYIVSNKETGQIIDLFKSDLLNIYRTVFMCEWTFEKFSKNMQYNSISVIGYKGNIASRIIERNDSWFDGKDVTLVGSKDANLLNKALSAEIVISAPRYVDKPWATKEMISKNKLVIPVHNRGWHNGIDDEFKDVYTDNIQQTKEWIREDAIELEANKEYVAKNTIVYNYGHVAFDYFLYKHLIGNNK